MSSVLGTDRNRLLVPVGALMLTAMPAILLRASLGDLAVANEAMVWVNPNWARAGFGFAGLWVVLAAWAALAWKRRRPTSAPSGSLSAGTSWAFAGLMLFAAGGLALASTSLTTAFAESRGYARCAPHDRFRAGNVRRNDVITHAYLRVELADDALRTLCGAGR